MKKTYLQDIKKFFEKYEPHLSAGILILGFIFDYLTLKRVDFLTDNLFIVLYLVIAGICIVAINLKEERELTNKFFLKVYEFLPFFLQFCFGGLFSAFVIFYSKSASLLSSGAFIFILFILLIGNEFFKERYEKLVFQIGIYFVSLFSFSIYFLPVLIKKMGAWVFLGSGIISLILIGLFIYMISRFSPKRFIEDRNFLILYVVGLFALMNVLYFANIIPPIPLSLKSSGVFHSIEKETNGSYLAVGEDYTVWYERFMTEVIHLQETRTVYVFGSVFAPTDLNTKIIHDWQYFDEEMGQWVSSSKIDFTIVGGRNDGFRGFTKKENISPGKWRVDIKTERDQVIGRVRFDVEVGWYVAPPKLYTL